MERGSGILRLRNSLGENPTLRKAFWFPPNGLSTEHYPPARPELIPVTVLEVRKQSIRTVMAIR